MDNRDIVEFYLGINSSHPFAYGQSSFRFQKGDFVNIKKANYEVLRVTFALDYSDEPHQKLMRQNVTVKEI